MIRSTILLLVAVMTTSCMSRKQAAITQGELVRNTSGNVRWRRRG